MARTYTDEFKVTALAALQANDGNVYRTANELGIPDSTLRRWANDGLPDELTELGDRKKGELAEALERLAWTLISLAEEKADKADFRQLMTGFGIAIDKLQLLRGEPTERTEVVSYGDARQRLAEQLDRYLPDGAPRDTGLPH